MTFLAFQVTHGINCFMLNQNIATSAFSRDKTYLLRRYKKRKMFAEALGDDIHHNLVNDITEARR
jgi:hypothetical protein